MWAMRPTQLMRPRVPGCVMWAMRLTQLMRPRVPGCVMWAMRPTQLMRPRVPGWVMWAMRLTQLTRPRVRHETNSINMTTSASRDQLNWSDHECVKRPTQLTRLHVQDVSRDQLN